MRASRFFTVLFLSAAALWVVPARAATQTAINQSVQAGLTWLAANQNVNGSWGTFVIGETGLAVWAFNEHALSSNVDPLSPSYPYQANVQNGLNHIFLNLATLATNPGDPDGNADSLYVYAAAGYVTYETAIAALAIATSQSPTAVVAVPGSPVNGWTYQRVAQDILDYFVWAQNEPGCATGGWGYSPNAQTWGDNSNVGYVAFALKFLADPAPFGFGLTIPPATLMALSTYVDLVQDPVDGDLNGYDGGSWYEPCSNFMWVNIYKTGHLMSEMLLVGDAPDSARMLNAVEYIEAHWNALGPQPEFPASSLGWQDDAHAAFTMMKGLVMAGITTLSPGGTPIDWFDVVSTNVIAGQNPNGSWPPTIHAEGANSAFLATAWSILTLQRAVGEQEYAAIPFLSSAGLALLALLGAGLAVVALRRH